MNTVTEITAATHPDVFARITRLDTPPASMWAVGNGDVLSDSAPRVMVTAPARAPLTGNTSPANSCEYLKV